MPSGINLLFVVSIKLEKSCSFDCKLLSVNPEFFVVLLKVFISIGCPTRHAILVYHSKVFSLKTLGPFHFMSYPKSMKIE